MHKENGNKKLRALDILAALKEQNVSAEELAAELNIIFDDYFTGTTTLKQKTLNLKLLNGQLFNITVEEVR